MAISNKFIFEAKIKNIYFSSILIVVKDISRGFSGSVFYYTTILFSHSLSGPDFALRKKYEFFRLLASRPKNFIPHQKLEGALLLRPKRNFAK